ncbi:MAG: SRPBCC domain-containing protein, partial [Candidatus Eisenbacteria bacterium]
LLLTALVPLPGRAEVRATSASGFLVRSEVPIAAPPGAVYKVLVDRLGEWWDPAHTFSGDSRNLSLDARPGGCFCESLPGGGGVSHMTVVYVAPGSVLRMSGGLGPLQEYGLVGNMTLNLSETDAGTTLELIYSVGGYYPADFKDIAPAVDGVLLGQMMRLKSLVETGSPVQK